MAKVPPGIHTIPAGASAVMARSRRGPGARGVGALDGAQPGHGVGSRGDPQLAVRHLQVRLDGVVGDVELVADLPLVEALSGQSQDVELPVREVLAELR